MGSLLKAFHDPSYNTGPSHVPSLSGPGLALFLFMLLTTACQYEIYLSVDFPVSTRL